MKAQLHLLKCWHNFFISKPQKFESFFHWGFLFQLEHSLRVCDWIRVQFSNCSVLFCSHKVSYSGSTCSSFRCPPPRLNWEKAGLYYVWGSCKQKSCFLKSCACHCLMIVYVRPSWWQFLNELEMPRCEEPSVCGSVPVCSAYSSLSHLYPQCTHCEAPSTCAHRTLRTRGDLVELRVIYSS